METLQTYFQQAVDIAVEWITSPAAYAQFALLVVAFLLAWVVAKQFSPRLEKLLAPAEDDQSMLSRLRRFGLLFLPLLLPLLAYAFTAAGEQVTRSIFGSGAVIAFGKRIFIFLAARILVEKVIYSPFLKMLGKYVLIPIAAIYALGLLPVVTTALSESKMTFGSISLSLDTLVTGIIAAAFLFWLGRWSNNQGTEYIRAREEMRPSVRELAAKTFELFVFGTIFFLLMNILGLPLTSLAVLGGAIGIGIGFGLQKIASNFVSGIILLLEGQATVGDYVALDGGEEGRIVRMMARATILETFDGRWIVVPNEDFITTRVTNFSDSGSANRYSVDFSVSYDTDINLVPDIVAAAVAKHPDVLDTPEPPDCELAGFGDSGVDFAVEFWVNGLDDGENKYSSDVLFLIWNALKEHNIEIPYPRREVRILGDEKLPS
jgi:small-conductance mechanosensitive channel